MVSEREFFNEVTSLMNEKIDLKELNGIDFRKKKKLEGKMQVRHIRIAQIEKKLEILFTEKRKEYGNNKE